MIELHHVGKAFTYTNPDPNSNASDMWVDYLLGLLGRSNRTFAAKKKRVVAVSDVSFDVRPGEFFGLLGPNGAGKSTLVKMISTILTPTTGTIRINGHDTKRNPARARASLSVVPANGWLSLDSHLTVGQNLEFWGRLFGLDKVLVERRSMEALKAVGLANMLLEQPTSLSSGMRQRLAIAKGLLVHSPIFVLDEPTANVDPISSSAIQDFIRNTLNRELGQTVVITTHNMSEAERLCDRVAIIDQGGLVACDAPATLIRRLEGRVVSISTKGYFAGILKDIRSASISRHIQETPNDDGGGSARILLQPGHDRSDLARLLEGLDLPAMTPTDQTPSLEDVFFDSTGAWSDVID